MDRTETIKRIRKALKDRSGKPWSVTGGRGTAYGWITIDAPPARCTWRWEDPVNGIKSDDDWREVNDCAPGAGHMGPDDRKKLAGLLSLDKVHFQGVSIPAASDYWQEYIDRAEGRKPTRIGEQYWD